MESKTFFLSVLMMNVDERMKEAVAIFFDWALPLKSLTIG